MQRALPDSDDGTARRTQVIVVLDVVESVRLMERDEADFIARWRRFVHAVRGSILPARGGRIHKSTGDGLMLEFADAAAALQASRDILQAAADCSDPTQPESALRLRIAANRTEYVADELDIYGAGVNLTARLAQSASAGEILATSALRDALPPVLRLCLQDLGRRELRHVSQPPHVFRVLGATAAFADGLESGANIVATAEERRRPYGDPPPRN